jgi:porphobilinogen synthase
MTGSWKMDEIVNDPTVEALDQDEPESCRRPAPTGWRPSDMMDGRIGAIRRAFEENGYTADGHHGL